jgi:ubiquinone/menaquinone biosynthesis C-methylase UbiE
MYIYDRYAEVYDESGQIGFSLRMIPYLDELLQRHPAPGRSLLDLACGTGTIALSFAQRGWEVYGVDASTRMLDQARRKAEHTAQQVILSQQDMRQFTVPHRVGLATCLYDSLNYMLTLADLRQVFARVASVLLPGGLLMADMNTQEALEHVWGNNTFFVEGRHLTVVMDSGYDSETGLSTVHIVGFVQQANGLYDRFDEHHTEIAYDNDVVRSALEEAGLYVQAMYECFDFHPPDEETRRIMWVARKEAVAGIG